MLFLYKQKRCQAGYTLVELMVAVALTGIVTMSIYKSYISVSTGYDVQDQVVEVQQNARVAMGRMVREIRMAGCDPSLSDFPTFLTLNSAEIGFSMDIVGDGDVNDVGENITYKLLNNELLRTDAAGGGARSIIKNVEALNFIYYDENSNITVVPADVRIVQVALVVRSSNEDYAFTDNRLYSIKDLTPAGNTVDIFDAGTLSANDKHFRRQMLMAVVRPRNMSMAPVD